MRGHNSEKHVNWAEIIGCSPAGTDEVIFGDVTAASGWGARILGREDLTSLCIMGSKWEHNLSDELVDGKKNG